MPFDVSWRTLLDTCDELPDGATLTTPLSHDRFRITDVQEHRIIIEFHSCANSSNRAEEHKRITHEILKLFDSTNSS